MLLLLLRTCHTHASAAVYDGSNYTQSWTGLSFLFSWSAQGGAGVQPTPAAGYSRQGLQALPLPRGECPPAKRMCIYRANNKNTANDVAIA